MKRLWWALGTLAVTSLLTGPVVWRLTGPKATRFPYATLPEGQSPTPASRLTGYAPFDVEVAAGLSLRGFHRRPHAADAPWVLFVHGNDRTLLASAYTFVEAARANRDWGVVMVAPRGFDGSAGSPSETVLPLDTEKVLRAVHQRLTPRRLVVAAFSMGVPLTVNAVASGARADALVFYAGPTKLILVPDTPWAKLMRGDFFTVEPALASVQVPVTVVHGSVDTTVPLAMGHQIAQRLGNRARLIEIPGAGHETVLQQPLALQALIQAMNKGLQ